MEVSNALRADLSRAKLVAKMSQASTPHTPQATDGELNRMEGTLATLQGSMTTLFDQQQGIQREIQRMTGVHGAGSSPSRSPGPAFAAARATTESLRADAEAGDVEGTAGDGLDRIEVLRTSLELAGETPPALKEKPPAQLPPHATERETASQRARLRAAQRKRLAELAQPKVRNWNETDDSRAASSAAAPKSPSRSGTAAKSPAVSPAR